MKIKNDLKKIALKTVQKASITSARETANKACLWYNHQPKLPDSVKSLRNF